VSDDFGAQCTASPAVVGGGQQPCPRWQACYPIAEIAAPSSFSSVFWHALCSFRLQLVHNSKCCYKTPAAECARTASRRFKLLSGADAPNPWNHSYVKMVSKFVQWAPGAAFYISGKECASGWKSDKRTSQACFKACKKHPSTCPLDCVCATAFHQNSDGIVLVSQPPSAPQQTPPCPPAAFCVVAAAYLLACW
jgi:hypothetical protein